MTIWWRAGPREAVLEEWAAARAEQLGGKLVKLEPTPGEKHRPDRVFLELKRRGARPTPEQLEALTRLAVLGFATGWADTRERVQAFFDRAMLPPIAMAVAIAQEIQSASKTPVPARPRRRPAAVPADLGAPTIGGPGRAPDLAR